MSSKKHNRSQSRAKPAGRTSALEAVYPYLTQKSLASVREQPRYVAIDAALLEQLLKAKI